ncbi:unnamed protein product [Closterium sp. NIES-65]|nr:unnamed protein product [Closterium sp. NIES-65]
MPRRLISPSPRLLNDKILPCLNASWIETSVKGKVAEMEGEVAEVKGEVAEIEGEVEEVKEEVAEVKEKMAEVKGELAAAVVEKSRMPCIVMPRRTAVVMLLLAFLLGAAIVYFG